VAGAFPYPLNQRLSRDRQQRFARQARGGITRGNDDVEQRARFSG
jgi:hypothetical protein